MPALPDFLADVSGRPDLGSSAKEKLERDARWLGDFSDDLTVAIALRKWDHAAALVEEGRPFLVRILHLADADVYVKAKVD